MPIRKSDIRLIDGNITSATEVIREYLSHVDFKVDQEKIKQNNAEIKVSNTQRSILKLYFSNSPQIVHWHLKQKSGNKVQIEVKSDLFPQFRIFYYAIIGFLLTGFSLFFTSTSSFKYKSINLLQQFDLLSFSSFNILIAVSFLVLVFIFYLKLINTAPYEVFLSRFYEILNKRNFTNEVALQSGFGFPDLLKVPLLLALFISIALLSSKLNISGINKHLPHYLFLSTLFITTFVLIILFFIMVSRPSIAIRVIFILTGFGLCVPIALFSNAPTALSYPGDIQKKFESYFEIRKIHNDIEIPKYLQEEESIKTRKFVQKVSIFYISACVLLFLIASVFFINIIRLPIHIVKDLKRFLLAQPDSDYYQALRPENSFYLFNFVIVLLWSMISAANILGLYFSFSIFERVVFSTNFWFESELARMFYANTQITFVVLTQSKFSSSITLLFHRMIMLIYSVPMIMIFILVLGKNLKSMLERYSLLKKQSGKYERIKKHLAEKIKKICEFVDIRVPIIRVVDSPDINATTQYLGLPIFRNVLVVSKGAWDELNDKEDEFDVLLAHEIWHIKKHTLVRRILCFISDYSLFGNGFLAVLQNSYRIEKEADEFAVRWLIKNYQEKNKAVSFLRSLLERIEEVNWKNVFLQPSDAFNFSMLKEDSYRDGLVKAYDNSSKVERIKINLKLLYQMYFGEEILSYFHPSIDQRIAWIQEKYGTEEAN